jgi:hypothetical protein
MACRKNMTPSHSSKSQYNALEARLGPGGKGEKLDFGRIKSEIMRTDCPRRNKHQ